MVSSAPAPSEVPATVDITRYEASKTLKDRGKKSTAREPPTAVSGSNDDHVVGPPKRMLATKRRMLLVLVRIRYEDMTSGAIARRVTQSSA